MGLNDSRREREREKSVERIKSCARLVKTLKRIGCRVQTKGISPANFPLSFSFLSFTPPITTRPITSLKFIRRNPFLRCFIRDFQFSIQVSKFPPSRNSASQFREAGILSCMAEGRRRKGGGILALTNLYDIRLCSCILLYHRRVLGQNFVSTKRKKLLLGLSFRGFRILSKAKT